MQGTGNFSQQNISNLNNTNASFGGSTDLGNAPADCKLHEPSTNPTAASAAGNGQLIKEEFSQKYHEMSQKCQIIQADNEQKDKSIKNLQKQIIQLTADMKAVINERTLLEMQLKNMSSVESSYKDREEKYLSQIKELKDNLFSQDNKDLREKNEIDLTINSLNLKMKSLEETILKYEQQIKDLSQDKSNLDQSVQLHI